MKWDEQSTFLDLHSRQTTRCWITVCEVIFYSVSIGLRRSKGSQLISSINTTIDAV